MEPYVMTGISDQDYMDLALRMAEQTLGQTGSNPAVGCVVVNRGRIVGMGAHLRMGEAHAEVHALDMAGPEAEGGTVYVTLEPCSHHGRTPPCCERLARERVKRVVVACEDPNPKVAGSGIRYLRERGIEVEVGVLRERARLLNEAFFKHIVTGMPFVTLKSAMTLDGKLATRTGDSKWISGERSREAVHVMRHRHAAIMVGVETVLRDNPRLTTRLPSGGLHPVRIIADSRLRIPPDANVLQDGLAPVILLTTEQAAERATGLTRPGVEVLPCGTGPRVDLKLAMKRLGERGIGSILLEGGATLNGAMLEAGLVDKLVLFIAPKIAGGGTRAPSVFENEGADKMADALRIRVVKTETVGEDLCVIGYPEYDREIEKDNAE
jgi:riboflavin biosynthesis protein RibD